MKVQVFTMKCKLLQTQQIRKNDPSLIETVRSRKACSSQLRRRLYHSWPLRVALLYLSLLAALPARATPPCDLDGNGKSELVVGAPGKSVNGVKGAGVVHVQYSFGGLFDTPTVLEDGDELLPAPDKGAGIGEAIACGDFDNDGKSDLVIGAPARYQLKGSVTVIYGSGSGPDVGTVVEITEDKLTFPFQPGVDTVGEEDDKFGQAFTVGDFDGNGVDDLAIGAPGDHVGTGNVQGAAFVLLGYANFRWTPGSSFLHAFYVPAVMSHLVCAEQPYSSGPTIALAAGNFDGSDGDELAIGLPGCGSQSYELLSGWRSGYGGFVDIARFDGFKFVNDGYGLDRFPYAVDIAWDGFGSALAAGDLDGDKRDDLIVSAPSEDRKDGRSGTVTIGAGTVYIYHSNGDGTFAKPRLIYDVGSYEEDIPLFGASLAVGDVDGDHHIDLVVGQPMHRRALICDVEGGQNPGQVWVFRKFANLVPGVRDPIYPGPKPTVPVRWVFGERVALIDANGDNIRDLVVGWPGRTYGLAPINGYYGNSGNSVGQVTGRLGEKDRTFSGPSYRLNADNPGISLYGGSWVGGFTYFTDPYEVHDNCYVSNSILNWEVGEGVVEQFIPTDMAGELLGIGLGH